VDSYKVSIKLEQNHFFGRSKESPLHPILRRAFRLLSSNTVWAEVLFRFASIASCKKLRLHARMVGHCDERRWPISREQVCGAAIDLETSG